MVGLLAFLITYHLPVMAVASGKVRVVAAVPINIRLQSVMSAVYAVVNVLTLVPKDPETSKVDRGVVVPMPICAFAYTESTSIPITNSFFIEWIFSDFGF